MDKEEQLNQIAREIAACKNCPLAATATNPVPGNGNPNTEIVLIGEAPGYWEDQKGIPFVGAAGKLLDQLLGSIKLTREDVFTTNILKHRPPGNRDPLPEEIAACEPFLDRQIEIIGPKAFLTLGRFAMSKFLPYGKISRDHGQAKIIEYRGKRYILIPMYHPAAALRSQEVENQLRQDFLKTPAEIERLKKQLDFENKENQEKKEAQEEQLSLI
jgi:DNA polymerase